MRDPQGQFTLDDLLVEIFHTIETMAQSNEACDPSLQDELLRAVEAMCTESVDDPVLRRIVTQAIFTEMRSKVACVEQCAVNAGLTKVTHMQKTLSTVLAIFSRINMLQAECERLIAQLHCLTPGTSSC